MILPRTAAYALAALALSTAAQAQQLAEGQHLRAQGRYAEARAVFAAVLREAEKLQPPNNRLVALVLDNMAVNETDSGDYGASRADPESRARHTQ